MEICDQEDENLEQESLLFYLVYCSRAAAPMSEDEIAQLVAIAQRNNANQHITGWLVYGSGMFFQWLEGKRDDVQRLMAAIAIDPRHHAVIVLSEDEEVRERLFSGWDMERVLPGDIQAVLLDAISATNDSQRVEALQQLLEELESQAITTGP